jgi:hypothetical protein
MLPRNTVNVAYKNSAIMYELEKYGRLKDSRASDQATGGFRRKAKSDETRAKEASERRYNRRSNICGTCFQAKAVGTGECGCE